MDAVIRSEMKSGKLKEVRWKGDSHHLFKPRVYFKSRSRAGKAAQILFQEWKHSG
jgi:hypothetical protein